MIKDLQLSATELREQELGKDQLIEDYLLKSQALGDLQGDGVGGVLNKLFWIGEWDSQATPYAKNAFGKEGGFAGVSLVNNNTDHIAPQINGSSESVYQGTWGSNSAVSRQVIAGQRYTIPESLFVVQYSIQVIAGNDYSIFSRSDVGTSQERLNQIAAFTASASGEFSNNVLVFAPLGEIFDVFTLISEPDPAPVITVIPYNYATPNSASTPQDGQIIHSDKSPDSLRVSKIDNNSVDQSAFLASVAVGEIINAVGQRWSVQANSDQGTWRLISIAPALQGSPDGVSDFTFETTAPATVSYAEDVDYWASNPNVQGFFTATGGINDVVFDQTARLIDIKIQRVIASPNWDLLPFIGEGALEGNDVGVNNFTSKYNFESLSKSETNASFDTNPETKLNRTAGLVSGEYEITVSFSATARTNRRVSAALYINDVLHEDVFDKESKDNNDNMWISKTFVMFLPTANHNFKVKFGRRGGGGGQEVSLANLRVIIKDF